MKQRINRIAVAALLLAVVPAAQAQFSDFLRSLSGSLRSSGGGNTAQQPQNGVTPTIGIRGMDEGGTVANAPAGEDSVLLDGWLSTRDEATTFASGKGLAARQVTLKSAAPAAEPTAAAPTEPTNQ